MPIAGERVPPVKAQKTERSHEENQERAYIAASRRADRSLEARVQSARMASEIHRRRTGRGLKVTEEIVIKEEMYEEEEDDLPRQFRHLTRHLQTNSPSMNHRVSAYITTQAAMASMARYNEVNRLFSESFPSAAAYQQQLNNSMYMAPLMGNNGQFSPTSPTMPSPSAQTDGTFSGMDRRISSANTATTSSSTPPALSPASHTMDTPDSRNTPRQSSAHLFPPLDSQSQQQQHTSSFTSELPNEIKMLGMANVDMNDPMAPWFFGGDPSSFNTNFFGQQPSKSSQPALTLEKTEPYPETSDNVSPTDTNHVTDDMLYSPVDGNFNSQFDNYSRMGTPSAAGFGADAAWDNLIDFGSEQ